MAKHLETLEEFVKLCLACDFLEHYHLEHTNDRVSRFRAQGYPPSADIYVVYDPELKKKMSDFFAPIIQGN